MRYRFISILLFVVFFGSYIKAQDIKYSDSYNKLKFNVLRLTLDSLVKHGEGLPLYSRIENCYPLVYSSSIEPSCFSLNDTMSFKIFSSNEILVSKINSYLEILEINCISDTCHLMLFNKLENMEVRSSFAITECGPKCFYFTTLEF